MSELLTDNMFHTAVVIVFAVVMVALLKRMSSFYLFLVGAGTIGVGVMFVILLLALSGMDRFQAPFNAPV